MKSFKSFNHTQQKIVLFLIVSSLTASAILIGTHIQREKALSQIQLVHSAFDIFSEESTSAEANSQKIPDRIIPEIININTASLEEFESLPNIGPVMAKRIIEYRQIYGSFRAIEEITKVKGIGQKTFGKIKERITVGTIVLARTDMGTSIPGSKTRTTSKNTTTPSLEKNKGLEVKGLSAVVGSLTIKESNTFDTKVNLNTASLEEIESLPRIGPVIAKRIIEYRQTHGGFKSVEEIREVKGIGEKTFEKIKELITVE